MMFSISTYFYINNIINISQQLGLSLRALYGDDKEVVGNLFQVSNQLTLGFSEEEIIDNLKSAVTDATIETLAPIQTRFNQVMADKAYLESVYRTGAERASRIAERTLAKLMKKIGFIAK